MNQPRAAKAMLPRNTSTSNTKGRTCTWLERSGEREEVSKTTENQENARTVRSDEVVEAVATEKREELQEGDDAEPANPEEQLAQVVLQHGGHKHNLEHCEAHEPLLCFLKTKRWFECWERKQGRERGDKALERG